MIIEELLPQLFAEHINQDQWQRSADLVWLVGQLSDRPCPAPIGVEAIEYYLKRGHSGAKNDTKVLERLHRQRVLHVWTGQGRHPSSYLVNPNIQDWRGVPWIPNRRRVLDLFLGQLADNVVHLRGDSLRKSRSGAGYPDARLLKPKPSMRRAKAHPANASAYSTNAQAEQGVGGLITPQFLDPAPSDNSLEIETSSYRGYDDDVALSAEAKTLTKAVQKATGARWLNGQPERELAALADANADRIERLVSVACDIIYEGRIRAPSRAAAEIGKAVKAGRLDGDRSGPDPEALLAGALNKLRIYESADPTGEATEELRQEVGRLQAALSRAAES